LDEKTLMAGLEELAEKAGVDVRYERMAGDVAFYPGGFCKVKGKPVIIINSRITGKERLQILARALKGFDLRDTYIKPAVREFLEKQN